MVSKRGLGHIEAVITLVVFIGFLIFAFSFFSPFRTSRTLDSTLDYAWREIEKNTSDNLETYSIVFDSSVARLVGINIPGMTNFNATILDNSGSLIPSFTNQLGVYFDRATNNFVVLQYSKHFDAGLNTIIGTILNSDKYTISSSNSKKIRFESLFLELKNKYSSNYAELKGNFNLPNRVQFGFSVLFSDGTKIETQQNIPENVEVISKNDRLEIMRVNGVTEFAEVNVKVW